MLHIFLLSLKRSRDRAKENLRIPSDMSCCILIAAAISKPAISASYSVSLLLNRTAYFNAYENSYPSGFYNTSPCPCVPVLQTRLQIAPGAFRGSSF